MPEINVTSLLNAVHTAARNHTPATIHVNDHAYTTPNAGPDYGGYYTAANVATMRAALDAVADDMRRRVNISPGNDKIGDTPNVSTLPWITCPVGTCGKCKHMCYAARRALYRATCRVSWARNTWYALNDPDTFFAAVQRAAERATFFRWHVSGDIPNAAYFRRMRAVAQACPGCRFLSLTSAHDIINASIHDDGPLPENLVVWLSCNDDGPVNNPYNLPATRIVARGEKRPAGLAGCPNDCSVCQRFHVGCWYPETSGGRRGWGYH